MTTPPEQPGELDDQFDRLLASPANPEPRDRTSHPRLASLLAAAAAPSEAGAQPGEQAALAAFRELVVEAAGTPSLAVRRSRRVALAAAVSAVAMVGGGVAAAATGSLPGAAQQTAKTVLGVIGVTVPGPNAPGSHPAQRGGSVTSPTPASTVTPGGADAAATFRPTPAYAGTPPTPGNSGPSRHHGNPTPTATTHPTPGHGKPSAPPVVSHRRTNAHSVGHAHPVPHARPANSRVMRGLARAISH